MFSINKPSGHERKVAFHTEAPFAKHDYRFRSRDIIRLAGQIWGESPSERTDRLRRERLFKKSRTTPVGLGFSRGDKFGPDNTYDTVSLLSSIPFQED